MTTPKEWLDLSHSEMRAEQKAGDSIHTATAAALGILVPGWEESVSDSISCSIVIHDLLEVAHNLRQIHYRLNEKLPGVLDELASIPKEV